VVVFVSPGPRQRRRQPALLFEESGGSVRLQLYHVPQMAWYTILTIALLAWLIVAVVVALLLGPAIRSDTGAGPHDHS
jgi:hypothetical protein